MPESSYFFSKLDGLGDNIQQLNNEMLNMRHEVNTSTTRTILVVSAFFSLLTGVMAWLGVQSLSNSIEQSIVRNIDEVISIPMTNLSSNTADAQRSVNDLIANLDEVSEELTSAQNELSTITSGINDIDGLSSQITQIQADVNGVLTTI